MRIAILGWGSLIWNPRELPIKSDWLTGGPILPIEFSRISGDGRLTLVIDPINGVELPTRYAISSADFFSHAISDLLQRENTSDPHIGYVDTVSNTDSSIEYPDQVPVHYLIADWANSNGFDGVVWTALPTNFRDFTGVEYSIDSAMSYLNGLDCDVYQLAIEYIANAPENILTKFRKNILT